MTDDMPKPVTDAPPTPVSERVRLRCKELGWSQAELARRIGWTPQNLNRIVHKDDPVRDDVEALANELDLDPGALDPRFAEPAFGSRAHLLESAPQSDVAFLAAALRALGSAFRELGEMDVEEAITPAKGKGDSMLCDSVAEAAIAKELYRFEPASAFLSEERPTDEKQRQNANSVLWVCDPVDRSAALRDLLLDKKGRTVAELLRDPACTLRDVTAPLAALTLVKNRSIRFSVLLDYARGTLWVAFPKVVVRSNILRAPDPQRLVEKGVPIRFVARSGTGVATFIGDKPEVKQRRTEWFKSLGFNEHQLPKELNPGGPARVLRLADANSAGASFDIATVIANCERLSEFIHWIPFCIHSEQLDLFELYADGMADDGVLLAPSPSYSVLERGEGREIKVRMDRLFDLPDPKSYRGALAVAHQDSRMATTLGARLKVRKLVG